MDIDIVFRIAGIGLITTVASQVLKRAERDDIATLAALAGLVIVLAMVVTMIGDFFQTVRSAFYFN
jgi:stage III sporulation protein AC